MLPSYAEVRVGHSIIPAGKPHEQFLAHLMLSIGALHLGDDEVGQKHLSYAHSIAADLEKHAQTYRSGSRVKIVGITSGTDDQEETLMVPVVGEHLVVPGIDVQQVAKRLKAQPDGRADIGLKRLELRYYDLRLRPARLRRSLAAIMDTDTEGSVLERTESLLGGCLADRLRPVDPMDLAHDYLTLTYDFSAAGNPMLADLALKQAMRAIDTFVDDNAHLRDMQSIAVFKAKIEALAGELRVGWS